MKVFLCFCLFYSLNVFAQRSLLHNKGGGNGQLVIIPNGHDRPIPYEAVKAWESAVYKSFDELPGINGNKEVRELYNKPYAREAKKWLERIKVLNLNLYNDLIFASKHTVFKMINDYIFWEHEPYPENEVNYKVFEKAAFYNGEIILSLPVMERVGPLKGVLTSEENRGFILVHELINAAYKDLLVEEKLKLGEEIIKLKMFNTSKEDFLISISQISPRFINYKNHQSFINIIETLIQRETDYSKKEKFIDLKRIENLYSTGESFEKNILNEFRNKKMKSSYEIQKELNHFYETLSLLGIKLKDKMISLNALLNYSYNNELDLKEIIKIVDPVTNESYENLSNAKILDFILEKMTSDFIDCRHNFSIHFDLETLVDDFNSTLKDIYHTDLKALRDGYPKLFSLVYDYLDVLKKERNDEFKNLFLKSFKNIFKEKGYEIDLENTISYEKSENSIKRLMLFYPGLKILVKEDIYSSKVFHYQVKKINSKRNEIVVRDLESNRVYNYSDFFKRFSRVLFLVD